MIDYLLRQKERISRSLDEYLRVELRELFESHPFGTDAATRLYDFSSRGKMIRGALVYMGAELYGYEGSDRPTTRLAVVMELLQSFLLIHDDIMDGDTLRRGAPSVFAQYEQLGIERSLAEPRHFGEAMGICAGDVAIFLATGLVAHDDVPVALERRLLRLISTEIARVGLAQMSDVYHGVYPEQVEESEIIDLYRYKTGRYTFSLPLMCGATISAAPERDIESLGRIGEGLGVVFQIKDDYIGLFGQTAAIGKNVGSDIAADKKTLYRTYLFERASAGDRARLATVFGASDPGPEDIAFVTGCMHSYGVVDDVEKVLQNYADETRRSIRNDIPDMPENGRAMLEQLLEYNLTREA
ncbi:MAG: polyprenyl synthetase family protein [Spirochaetaceae bacterium]|nr:MAG: polyprenyl synthetase family protein [Spirochaetaceae bacterium]